MLNMTNKTIGVALCAAVLAGWTVSGFAESTKEAQVTLIAAPGGMVYAAGVEFGGSANSSFGVRVGGYSYSYKDGDYWEDGSGSIVGMTGRFYAKKSMDGMYFGAGIDMVSGETTWGGWSSYGYKVFSKVAPHAQVGYKIVGDGVSFEPSLFVSMIGDKEVSTVVGFGLTLGARF